MNLNYAITYLKCQSCTAKIHCDDCAAELQERLARQGATAIVDIPNRAARIETTLDEDDLLDLMEDMGLFAD